MARFTNIVEIQLDETTSTKTSWIQIMTLGEYKHPEYGKISFTRERLQRFADGVNNNITDIQLDVDYDHKDKTNKAAGWIQKAEVRDDGLWALVEWTPNAYKAIKEKEYKYFSPAFEDTWKHPKSGVVYNDVLRGGAITNRPFLKDIAQLQLSENTEMGNLMDPNKVKELATMLGLDPETATEQDVIDGLIAKVQAAGQTADENLGENSTAPAGVNPNESAPPISEVTVTATLSEGDKSKLLSDDSGKKLLSIMESQAKLLSDQAIKLKELSVSSRVAKLNEVASAKKVIIPGKTTDKIKKFFSDISDGHAEAAAEIFDDLLGMKPQAGESGGTTQDSIDADAVKKFSDAVNQKMTKDSVSYAVAAQRLSEEQPELFENYRNASYVKEGN